MAPVLPFSCRSFTREHRGPRPYVSQQSEASKGAPDGEIRPPSPVETPRASDDDRTDERIHHDADTAVRSPAGKRPFIERVTIFEPAAGEDLSAHEVRQAADRPEGATARDVIRRSADLA